jgi:hypothetical protein
MINITVEQRREGNRGGKRYVMLLFATLKDVSCLRIPIEGRSVRALDETSRHLIGGRGSNHQGGQGLGRVSNHHGFWSLGLRYRKQSSGGRPYVTQVNIPSRQCGMATGAIKITGRRTSDE